VVLAAVLVTTAQLQAVEQEIHLQHHHRKEVTVARGLAEETVALAVAALVASVRQTLIMSAALVALVLLTLIQVHQLPTQEAVVAAEVIRLTLLAVEVQLVAAALVDKATFQQVEMERQELQILVAALVAADSV
jgi:hypothetical protein